MKQDVLAAHWVSLVYELLDAHDDTARLAVALDAEPEWAEHLEYLRRLQRVGRELLATGEGLEYP